MYSKCLRTVLIAIFCIYPTLTHAQVEYAIYANPGIRLGYVFGEGFTFGTELTFGVFFLRSAIHTSVGVGYQRIPKEPKRFCYVSGQAGFFIFGASIGNIFDADGHTVGSRFAAYAIWLVPGISYEVLKFPSLSTEYRSFGFWGKFPLVIGGKGDLGLSTCFAEGTKIAMADGSSKNIEDIEVGDIILSYNFDTAKTEPDEVMELYTTRNMNLATFTFGEMSPLQATIDHPFYVLGKGWCSIDPDMTREVITNMPDVQRLEVGDTCMIYRNGQMEEIELASVEPLGSMNRTYTIQRLKHNETFFAGGVLVGTEVVRGIKNITGISSALSRSIKMALLK